MREFNPDKPVKCPVCGYGNSFNIIRNYSRGYNVSVYYFRGFIGR